MMQERYIENCYCSITPKISLLWVFYTKKKLKQINNCIVFTVYIIYCMVFC